MTKEEMEKQIHDFAELMYKTGYKDGETSRLLSQECINEYNRGLNDAWDCARKVMLVSCDGGLSLGEHTEIFGSKFPAEILNNLTASEVIAKIKEYEEKQTDDEIKLWDEVIITKSSYGYAGCKGIVTNILRYDLVEVMINYGTVYNYDTETIKKTGKSYSELGNILDQLKGDKE